MTGFPEKLTVCTLFSSSKGNCSLFRYGDTAILVDAGRSAKYIKDSLDLLGIAPEQINAILLTHPHSDHTGALKVWTRRYGTPVHAAGATAEDVEDLCASGTLRPHPIIFTEDIGDFTISSFVTSHDTRCSVGYRFSLIDGGGEFGIATDLGCVTDAVRKGLSGCRGVILESNHDVDMLMCGPYAPEQKRRILSDRGHLSNAVCASFAAELAAAGTEAFVLAHLSPVNNLPEKASSCASDAMRAAGVSPTIAIASPERPTVLFCGDGVSYGVKSHA